MNVRILEAGDEKTAVCVSDEVIITDGQSALDFAVNVGYAHDCRNIVVNKAAVTEDFFDLSSGVAGEVTQKFVNFRYRLAITGDFSSYTSKPLRDYIRECNGGVYIYFAKDEREALEWINNIANQ